jgi:hypothetical protein
MKSLKLIINFILLLLITNCQGKVVNTDIVAKPVPTETPVKTLSSVVPIKPEIILPTQEQENITLPQKLLYFSTSDYKFSGIIFDLNAKIEKIINLSNTDEDCLFSQITDKLIYLTCKTTEKTIFTQIKYKEKFEQIIPDYTNSYLLSPKRDMVTSNKTQNGYSNDSLIVTDIDNNMKTIATYGYFNNWFPNGRRICYLTNEGIYFIDSNGENKVKVITTSKSAYNVKFSPSGKFMSYQYEHELHLLNIETNINQIIAKFPLGSYEYTHHEWLQESDDLLVEEGNSYPTDLIKIKAEEPDKQILLEKNIENYIIFFNEKKILYKTEYGISLMNFDGSEKTFITNQNDTFLDYFKFSPDRKKITYYTNHYILTCELCFKKEDVSLYLVNSDGTNNHKIYERKNDGYTNMESIVWSDNSSKFTFMGNRDPFVFDIVKDKSFKLLPNDSNPFPYQVNFIWLK